METFFVTFLTLSLRVLGVFGHGAMYYPNPWHTSKGCTIDDSPHDCWFDMKVHDGWMDDCKVGVNGGNPEGCDYEGQVFFQCQFNFDS